MSSNIEIQWLGSNAIITLANSSYKPIKKSSKCTNVPSIPDIYCLAIHFMSVL